MSTTVPNFGNCSEIITEMNWQHFCEINPICLNYSLVSYLQLIPVILATPERPINRFNRAEPSPSSRRNIRHRHSDVLANLSLYASQNNIRSAIINTLRMKHSDLHIVPPCSSFVATPLSFNNKLGIEYCTLQWSKK